MEEPRTPCLRDHRPGRAGGPRARLQPMPWCGEDVSLENTDPHNSAPSDQAIPREELTPAGET